MRYNFYECLVKEAILTKEMRNILYPSYRFFPIGAPIFLIITAPVFAQEATVSSKFSGPAIDDSSLIIDPRFVGTTPLVAANSAPANPVLVARRFADERTIADRQAQPIGSIRPVASEGGVPIPASADSPVPLLAGLSPGYVPDVDSEIYANEVVKFAAAPTQ